MKEIEASYAVYVSPFSVEILDHEQSARASGRLVCKQANYSSLFRFARNLALQYRLPLHNYCR
ncbi:MAG: hypothetical protein AAGE59_22530 [Cyanobacteria bacterium P01_F01_bin.86]